MKVFIVEEGEYSDRCVIGVYSTREKAQQRQQMFGGAVEERMIPLTNPACK